MSKPRVLFLVNDLNSGAALYNILSWVQRNLTRLDGEVVQRMEPFKQAPTPRKLLAHLSTYAAVVYDCEWTAWLYNQVFRTAGEPTFAQVPLFHIIESPQHGERKRMWMDLVRPTKVLMTAEDGVSEQVRGWGHPVSIVPFSFDASRFHHLPYPEEFTVGALGANMAHKRFDDIERAAEQAGVKCIISRRPSHEGGDYVGKELDFYAQLSCYVCASWAESGPLPPIEAMLCGRPVVSTRVGMMPNLPIYLINNVDDLDRAIKAVKQDFIGYARIARNYEVRDTSRMYEDAIYEAICYG